MELAAAVFTTVASAASAGASAVGSAVSAGASALGSVGTALGSFGTAAGGATGGGSFLSSLMQGGMSVLGGISAMREGDEKAAALREQGLQAQDDARQERLAGMQRTDQLRRQLLDEQGQRDVAYAASGIDLSFGTPVVARAQADDDAARALAISGETTNARAAQYEQRAASYRAAAGRAKSTGLLNALGIGAKTMMSAANRG